MFPVNSSWAVTESLPLRLEATEACPTPIRIVTPPAPIKVAYHPVMAFVPTLLSPEYSDPAPDIVLHIGMAAGRSFYTLETAAYRDGYDKIQDVEGLLFSKQEVKEVWGACPPTLVPGWDVDDVLKGWRRHVRDDLDVRLSDHPGNFLCGFIYYASLARMWQQTNDRTGAGMTLDGAESIGREKAPLDQIGKADLALPNVKSEKRVIFLHVPDVDQMGSVSNGVEVAVGLIRALVESRSKGLCGNVQEGQQQTIAQDEDGTMW